MSCLIYVKYDINCHREIPGFVCSDQDPAFGGSRLALGSALRQLQAGETLAMPLSRPLPTVGHRYHELRVLERGVAWRLVYHLDTTNDAVVVLHLFKKKAQALTEQEKGLVRERLQVYYRK